MDDSLYHYRAIVNAVPNGSSCTVDIDLGLGTWLRDETLHLSRIDAPELKGKASISGIVSRDFLCSQIMGKEVHVQTVRNNDHQAEQYQAEIWVQSEENGWININDLMVNAGQAVYVHFSTAN